MHVHRYITLVTTHVTNDNFTLHSQLAILPITVVVKYGHSYTGVHYLFERSYT